MEQTSSQRVIDTHTHHLPEPALRILDAVARREPPPGITWPPSKMAPMLRLDMAVAAMDAAGVDVSVLSPPPLGLIADAAARAELCAAVNDGLAQACARHPGRFVMAAMLPLPDCAAAERELERVGARGCVRALFLVAQTTLYEPDAIGLEAVAARGADMGLPLILHPTSGVVDLSSAFDDFGLGSGMHAMISHSLAAARIIQSGMLDRNPRLELILTHLGGVLPFLAERLDSRAPADLRSRPSEYLRTRVWVDGCGYPAGPALRCAIDALGADRLMIGSDWPSRPIAPALESIDGLGLAPEDTAAIGGATAARWFDPARARADPFGS